MKIKLFQISNEKDKNNLKFMNSSFVQKHGGIDSSSYELVFEGELDVKRLDDIFTVFNVNHPEGYTGHSMSVSDIVWAEGLGWFFCDSIGYAEINCAVGENNNPEFSFKSLSSE